ncbi:hypothetical protein SETIT_8G059200v2 [Setaria italica]|uniref:DUF4220 domain-containing protein n=1 Tax=Setaria italica TaxID=4555 RepID=K3ZLC9_SETIT|nr:hypothetical protein SETIT_8G059200v2 [Setaria italica]
MPKYIIPNYLRRCIWLAYTSRDVLAIYALATIFNRNARASEHAGMATSLEDLWAPLLLVHLGGRDEITALNIQENEQWTRHAMTIVSQVTVALYAFYKSWPRAADGRILLSAIMLFISGIIKFCEKPLALRSASINRLVPVSSIIKGKKRKPNAWERCFTEVDARYKSCWKKGPRQEDQPILSEMDQVQVILSDISLLAAVGKEKKKHVLAPLKPGLIYTRANVIYAPAYMACDFLLVPALYIAAITLFVTGDKKGYNTTDMKMTYIFMVFTAVLDVVGMLISWLVYGLMSKTRKPALCMTLPKYHLIDSVAKRMKPKTGCLLKSDVTEFVVYKLLKPGKVEGLDLSSYRILSLTEHNWALSDDLREYVRDKGPESTIRRSYSRTRRAYRSTVKDYPLFHDACKLAEELMAMGQEEEGQEKRSKLMFGVWTGMLCYSASMCRGYLHAKSLGEGGEFFSYIWIVISLKGGQDIGRQASDVRGSDDVWSPNRGVRTRYPVAVWSWCVNIVLVLLPASSLAAYRVLSIYFACCCRMDVHAVACD